jgi:hypothetical protein
VRAGGGDVNVPEALNRRGRALKPGGAIKPSDSTAAVAVTRLAPLLSDCFAAFLLVMNRAHPAGVARAARKESAAAAPRRSLLDVAGYVAALGYGDEAWRVCYTCRLAYHGDGSETSELLLRALATRTQAGVTTDDELTTRCRLSHAARAGNTDRVRALIRAGTGVRGHCARRRRTGTWTPRRRCWTRARTPTA